MNLYTVYWKMNLKTSMTTFWSGLKIPRGNRLKHLRREVGHGRQSSMVSGNNQLEWRQPVSIFDIDTSTMINQQFHHVSVTSVDGPEKRRPAVVVLPRNEADMLADQQLGSGYIAKVRSEPPVKIKAPSGNVPTSGLPVRTERRESTHFYGSWRVRSGC